MYFPSVVIPVQFVYLPVMIMMRIFALAVPLGAGQLGGIAGIRWIGIHLKNLCGNMPVLSTVGAVQTVLRCSAPGWTGKTVPGPSASALMSIFKGRFRFSPLTASWTLRQDLPVTVHIAGLSIVSVTGWHRRDSVPSRSR